MSKQVFKGSKSLDFLNNKIKNTSSLSNAKSTVHIDLPKKKPVKHLKYTTVSNHPFFRPTEILKLLTVFDVRSKPINSFFAEVTQNNNKKTFIDSLRFGSPAEAFEFFGNIKQLQTLKSFTLPNLFDPESLSQNARNQLDEHIQDHLDQLYDVQIKDKSRVITNQEKLLYFISTHLQAFPSSVSAPLIQQFITTSGNHGKSKTVLYNYLSKITKLEPEFSLGFREDAKLVCEDYTKTYNTTYDISLLHALVSLYKHHNRYQKVKDVLLEFERLGYVPEFSIVEDFVKDAITRYDSNRTLSLKRFIGLDNILYTAFNGEIARNFIKISKNPEELTAVLNILESKYTSDELIKEYQDLESTLVTRIITLRDSSKNPDQLSDPFIEILNRLTKHAKLSEESKVLILESSVNHGSFILASSLLKQVKIRQHIKTRLRKSALAREIKQEYGVPGYDQVSRAAFLELLYL